MVWPVSGSLCTRNVGSSCARLLHGVAQLVLVGLGLGLDGHGNNRRGKFNRFQDDGLFLIAKRVAGGHALQADAGGDIARVDRVDFLALVGVHPKQSANALARRLGGVINVAAGLQNAGVNANVSHVADERVGHDLEGQRRKRLDHRSRGAAPHRRWASCPRPEERRAAKADNPRPHRAAAECPCS